MVEFEPPLEFFDAQGLMAIAVMVLLAGIEERLMPYESRSPTVVSRT
jgi:hypothetical protein